jgi:hypothetical protein
MVSNPARHIHLDWSLRFRRIPNYRLQKNRVAISFCMSVRLNRFSWNLLLESPIEIRKHVNNFAEVWQICSTSREDLHTFLLIHVTQWGVSNKSRIRLGNPPWYLPPGHSLDKPTTKGHWSQTTLTSLAPFTIDNVTFLLRYPWVQWLGLFPCVESSCNGSALFSRNPTDSQGVTNRNNPEALTRKAWVK